MQARTLAFHWRIADERTQSVLKGLRLVGDGAADDNDLLARRRIAQRCRELSHEVLVTVVLEVHDCVDIVVRVPLARRQLLERFEVSDGILSKRDSTCWLVAIGEKSEFLALNTL